jgi:hypothetical protein
LCNGIADVLPFAQDVVKLLAVTALAEDGVELLVGDARTRVAKILKKMTERSRGVEGLNAANESGNIKRLFYGKVEKYVDCGHNRHTKERPPHTGILGSSQSLRRSSACTR